MFYLAGNFLARAGARQALLALKEGAQYHRFVVSPSRQTVLCHKSEEGVHELTLLGLADGAVVGKLAIEGRKVRTFAFLREKEVVVVF